MERTDVAIIGGGIVGLATAMALLDRVRCSVIILEAEAAIAQHQTGHNSGVIHSGLYYKPGSLKATLCAAGREAMYDFCAEHSIPHERCGKIVLAVTDDEARRLVDLERRGRQNGLTGLRRLNSDELREIEPQACGTAALHVPETGIVDFIQVARTMATRITERGGAIHCNTRVTDITRDGSAIRITTTRGEFKAGNLVTCAGLQADRVAGMSGVKPQCRIVPFRGEYYELVPSRRAHVRNLIYPVPDPRFPFLGVHLTRLIDGGVEAGPNAVLALRREGYYRGSFSPRDAWSALSWRGFRRMAREHWRYGLMEMQRSYSKRRFAKALQRLVPDLTQRDLGKRRAGVRAQAVGVDGRLIDDFHIVEAESMIHILNAPSPAATASLAIGDHIARLAQGRFRL